jgi:ADP-heptose:LPS heptosyltransferase
MNFPSPNAPMVGPYLARRSRSALVFRAIDIACKLAPVKPQEAASEPHSVLVSQGGHLGDLIMTLPMLHWLRVNRPNARIGLLVGSWSKPMLPSISELYDQVHFADHFMLNRSNLSRFAKIKEHRRTWKSAAEDLRRAGYDLAFEAFPFFPNNIPLLRASGIPTRVGFTSGSWSPLLTRCVAWTHAPRHVSDYPRDLLRALFSDENLKAPFSAYYPRSSANIQPVEGEYVVVHTGTGNAIREWDERRWCELVDRLLASGERVVLAGAGRTEAERSSRIAEMNRGALNLTNKLSWDEFVGLIANAKHTICLESSSAHLSASFGRPTTTIMPGINMAAQLGPYGPHAAAVTHPTPCAPCYLTLGCDAMSCIRDVSVTDVERAFRREAGNIL